MDHDTSFLCVLLEVVSDLANVVSPVVEGGHQGVKDARSAEDFSRMAPQQCIAMTIDNRNALR